MAFKLKTPARLIRSPQQLRDGPRRSVTEIVETSHANQILGLPSRQRKIVIQALKEGNRVGEIARYAAEQGWLTKVSENTFKQYLMAFRREFPEMCEGNDEDTIDALSDGKRPSLDEEVELERLFRLQKVRLKVGVDFEKTTGFLNKDLHKDVLAAGELVDKLASLRGKKSGVGRPGSTNTNITPDAAEHLRKVDLNEAAQERLVSAMNSLVGLVRDKKSTEIKAS